MEKQEIKKNTRPKPPDGGWGWAACLGSSLITLSLRSLDPSFGLIFNDRLKLWNIDSTMTSTVASVLDACSNFSGIFVGFLLNKFSYRTVAAVGSMISCIGLITTAFANSIKHVIVTYSILTGIGTGLAVASAFVALNTYFDKKRGQAVSFSSAGTALAMMLVPQAARLLLAEYGFQGTMLIFGAWAMHSIVGSSLLRPLKIQSTKKSSEPTVKVKLNAENSSREADSLLVIKTPDENSKQISETEEKIPNTLIGQLFQVITNLFDVELLTNYSYLNVIFGLSLFNVAEANFKLIIPFFLDNNFGMGKEEVAYCLSLTAFTDIVARILLPIIYQKLGFKKRRIFWVNMLFVAMGRSILAECSNGIWLFIILVINGFIRGAAIQNMLLSVSETCELKTLPNAFGLFMVSKGIFSLVLGPLVGFIRDYSESYKTCIHSMNILILICFINWSIEFILPVFRKRKVEETESTSVVFIHTIK